MIDATLPVHAGMVVWPGDPCPEIETVRHDGSAVSRLSMSSHCGTHIDAPAHFIAGGSGIDAVPLERLVGPCMVVDCRTGRGRIEPSEVRIERRMLLRTGAAERLKAGHFDRDYRGLSENAARMLIAEGVQLVGIDTLSIEPFDTADYAVHKLLLSAGIVIVEGLDLTEAVASHYRLMALPLRLQGLDGSPARVILE